MDEKRIRDLVIEVLKKMQSDILILNKGEKTELTNVFLEVFHEMNLSVLEEECSEDFIMPNKILYLTGASIQTCINILFSEEDLYKNIRRAGQEITVFVEVGRSEVLSCYENGRSFIDSMKKMLEEIGVFLLNFQANTNKTVRRSIFIEKKIITLRDVDIEGLDELVILNDAKLTMALSDVLRDKRIQVRRI